MQRRYKKNIEKDFKAIRRLVGEGNITSINEIVKKMNLPNYPIKKSLSKHPKIKMEIMEKLKDNRKVNRKKN